MGQALNVKLYLITDEECLQGKDLFRTVEEALQAGVTLVQYREKSGQGGAMLQKAVALRTLCHQYGVPLLVNDRLDIALLAGADGVHLGQSDLPVAEARKLAGPDFLIGATAHNVAGAIKAQRDGADYLGCGAVFTTVTKKDTVPLGLEGLRLICETVKIPVVGIAGVTAENYPAVLQAGAEGAAVISAILGQADVKAAVATFLQAFDHK